MVLDRVQAHLGKIFDDRIDHLGLRHWIDRRQPECGGTGFLAGPLRVGVPKPIAAAVQAGPQRSTLGTQAQGEPRPRGDIFRFLLGVYPGTVKDTESEPVNYRRDSSIRC